jgi:serine/threonine-protein kinase
VGGQFRLEQKLGEGGMGELFLACQLEVERPVVVKFVHAHVAMERPESTSRLRREAQALAQVNHPNVVQLYSFGHHDDQAYLVMEYVAGITLAKALARGGAMAAARAVPIAMQMAAGLSAAHECGVVHRDLKPDNVMLTARAGELDVVKLVDFGIAKLAELQGDKLTRTGLVVGTPQYMAPEQIEANVVDERSDIYCFGLILYEMLTGASTFTGTTPYELLTQHVKGQVVPPSRHVRSVSPALEGIVLRCLQKDPARRFDSAQALRTALGATLAAPLPRAPVVEETQDLPQDPAPSRRPVAAAASTPPAQRIHHARPAWQRWAPGLAAVGLVAVGAVTVFRDKLPLTLHPLGESSGPTGTATEPTAGAGTTPPSSNASDWAPSAASAEPPGEQVAPAEREQQLSAAAACLNQSAGRAYDSYYRYDDWVDLAGGPTGHETNIYGLYTISVDDCPTAQPSGRDADLTRRFSVYASAVHTLDVLTKKADRYYEQEDYKDDDMRQGKSMHGPLVAAFRAFADGEKELRRVLQQRRRTADEALIKSLPTDNVERSFHELRLKGFDLFSLGLCSSSCMRQLSVEHFRDAIDAFASKLEQLETQDRENELNAAGAKLLEDAKKYARHIGPKPGWSTGDRMNLDDPLAGWMVDGSPYSLVKMAEGFVEAANGTDAMEARGIVDITPRIAYPAPDQPQANVRQADRD